MNCIRYAVRTEPPPHPPILFPSFSPSFPPLALAFWATTGLLWWRPHFGLVYKKKYDKVSINAIFGGRTGKVILVFVSEQERIVDKGTKGCKIQLVTPTLVSYFVYCSWREFSLWTNPRVQVQTPVDRLKCLPRWQVRRSEIYVYPRYRVLVWWSVVKCVLCRIFSDVGMTQWKYINKVKGSLVWVRSLQSYFYTTSLKFDLRRGKRSSQVLSLPTSVDKWLILSKFTSLHRKLKIPLPAFPVQY